MPSLVQSLSQHRRCDACTCPGRGQCCSHRSGFCQGNGPERPAAHPVSVLQSLSSEEPFELAVEILTNPSLVHNEEQEQMLRARFQVQLLLTAPQFPYNV